MPKPKPESGPSLKRPLVLHARMMNGTGGGPDKTIVNSPRFLEPMGYDCICAFYRPPNDPGFSVIRTRAEDAGADLVEIDDGGILDFSVIQKTIKLCRERKVNIWHGHDYKTNLIGWIASKFHRMRLITTAHGWVDYSGRLPTYYQYEKKWILPRYEKVICVSSSVMDQAIAGGTPKSKCTIIENAIDNEQFCRRQSIQKAKQQKFPWSADTFLIGSIGRLSAEKGFDLLIDAVGSLIRSGLTANLVIAGDGPERQNLEKQIEELGMQDRIHLLGFCQDTLSFYESIDLFVLSSYREGLPNVVLEAMAVGTPIIATKVDGVPRIITDGQDGFLVSPGSSQELVRTIKFVIENIETREKITQRGVETISEKWSFANRMNHIRDVYDCLTPF